MGRQYLEVILRAFMSRSPVYTRKTRGGSTANRQAHERSVDADLLSLVLKLQLLCLTTHGLRVFCGWKLNSQEELARPFASTEL